MKTASLLAKVARLTEEVSVQQANDRPTMLHHRTQSVYMTKLHVLIASCNYTVSLTNLHGPW